MSSLKNSRTTLPNPSSYLFRNLALQLTAAALALSTAAHGATVVDLRADMGVTLDNNGQVSEWRDQSGNGNTATNPNGNRPIPAQSADGHSLFRFNGNQYLASPPTVTTNGTLFLVYGGVAETSNIQGRPIGWADGYAGSYGYDLLPGYNGGILAAMREDFAAGDMFLAGNVAALEIDAVSWGPAGVTFDRLFADGTSESTSNTNITTIAGGGLQLHIGCSGDGDSPFIGDVAEVLADDTQMSSTDRFAVMQTLGVRWLGFATPAISYAPAEGTNGLLLFEDLWPSDGDLDFNDENFSWNYQFYTDGNGNVDMLVLSLSVLSVGAHIHNGLYLRLPVPASTPVHAAMLSSPGASLGSSVFVPPLAIPNEPDLVFELTADTRSLFPGPTGDEAFINTEPNVAVAPASPLTFAVVFDTPTAVDLSQVPFDLYIAQTETPSHEIHAPQYAGTAAMDTHLFNTADDGSAHSDGLHFVNSNGLPFAIAIPDIVEWPQEAVSIDKVYTGIVPFAQSGGTYNNDWYTETPSSLGYSSGASSPPPSPGPIYQAGAPYVYPPTSCLQLNNLLPHLPSGTYSVALGPDNQYKNVYCDMTTEGSGYYPSGSEMLGWTMVANQVPGSPLPNSIDDAFPSNFGAASLSWRVGSELSAVAPISAWKMTDQYNTIYFKPDCVVDWSINYIDQGPSDCTTAYTGYADGFQGVGTINGGWDGVSTNGIGINDQGNPCSMRAFQALDPYSSQPVGVMLDCNWDQDETISLWFQ